MGHNQVFDLAVPVPVPVLTIVIVFFYLQGVTKNVKLGGRFGDLLTDE